MGVIRTYSFVGLLNHHMYRSILPVIRTMDKLMLGLLFGFPSGSSFVNSMCKDQFLPSYCGEIGGDLMGVLKRRVPLGLFNLVIFNFSIVFWKWDW